MKNALYDKYYNVLVHINNVMNITENEDLKEISKKTIISTVNKLIESDKDNKSLYEGILVEFNLKESVQDKTVIENNNDISVKENDLTNDNKIDLERDLQAGTFKPEENVTVDKVLDQNNKDISENEGDLVDSTNDNKKDLDSILQARTYKSEDNDIVDKVLDQNNKDISENEGDLVDTTNDNSKKIEDLGKEKEEGFKIKNIKKSFISKSKIKALSFAALVGYGVFNHPILTGVGGYLLYKKGVHDAKKLIEKNGFSLDKDDNLIDENGHIITKEDVGRIKYSLIKRELLKVNNGKGRIDKSYKKNKLTSMLLNVSIKDTIKNKFNEIKAKDNKISDEVSDINKGMGKIR